MSISTKRGDKGETSLWSGERVKKDDLRVEAYGTLDELDSHIGEAKHYVKDTKCRQILEDIQDTLMNVMGELASLQKPFISPISSDETEKLTNIVLTFENDVQLKGFVVPGNTIQSAKLDVCRTIARRAERRIVSLNNVAEVSANIISYVNRLSDLFFIMARYEEKIAGALKCKANKKCL